MNTENLFCNKCSTVTKHKIVWEDSETEQVKEYYEGMNLDLWEATKVQIFKCQGCWEITVRKSTFWSEDRDKYGELIEKNIQMLPPRHNPNLRPPQSLKNIPENLFRLYNEIIDTYNNRNYTLCAGGIRAIIEGICTEVGILKGGILKSGDKIKNIEDKVNALFEKGIITKKHSTILHSFRALGNNALHEIILPTKEELEQAITIINHSIDSVILFKHNEKNKRNEKL
ncbi:MAG: DUF4145 domain-containing protein [Bacteroidota bacterium]